MKRRRPIAFEVVPGTDIAEIAALHPEWTEEQCREEQSRVALAAFIKISNVSGP
jgi:hypothetical protein